LKINVSGDIARVRNKGQSGRPEYFGNQFHAGMIPFFIQGKEAFGVGEERQNNAKEGLNVFHQEKGALHPDNCTGSYVGF